jgi:hypothetical protein
MWLTVPVTASTRRRSAGQCRAGDITSRPEQQQSDGSVQPKRPGTAIVQSGSAFAAIETSITPVVTLFAAVV